MLASESGEKLCVGIRRNSLSPGDPLSLGLSFGIYCNDGSSIVKEIPRSRFQEEHKKKIEARALKSLSSELREVARVPIRIHPGMVRSLPVYSDRALPRGSSLCLFLETPNIGRSKASKSIGCTANTSLREVIDPLNPNRLPVDQVLGLNGFISEGKALMPIYSLGKTYKSKFRFFSRL